MPNVLRFLLMSLLLFVAAALAGCLAAVTTVMFFDAVQHVAGRFHVDLSWTASIVIAAVLAALTITGAMGITVYLERRLADGQK